MADDKTTVSREEFDRLNEDREPRVLPGLLALGRETAPTPPAVPDWLDAAVGALGDEVFCADHVNNGRFEDDPDDTCGDCDSVRGRIILAALPHITRGAADAVEAELEEDPVDPGYVCGIENAATIVRNFGSEVGRA